MDLGGVECEPPRTIFRHPLYWLSRCVGGKDLSKGHNVVVPMICNLIRELFT